MIPIKDILSHVGIEPVMSRCGGEQLMYNSPLRPDKNASFSVNTRKNLWMDFGTQLGGNVIDLAIALKGDCTFSEALAWLEEQVGGLDMVVSEGGINRFLEELKERRVFDILYYPAINEYMGRNTLQIVIRGWKFRT